MAGNRKPRKPKKDKPIHVPMTAGTYASEATRLHLTISLLCAEPTVARFNEVTRIMAVLTDAISHMRGGKTLVEDRDRTANAIRTAVLTLDGIATRTGAGARLAVTATEAASLKAAALVLDEAIARIPANILQAATILMDHAAWQKR